MNIIHLTLSVALIFTSIENAFACLLETTCNCINTQQKTKELRCDNTQDITQLFSYAIFPKDTVFTSMNFAPNTLKSITHETFGNRTSVMKATKEVKKLNLAWNSIEFIEHGSLDLFSNLTKLNLSHNNIGRLSKDMFNGLILLKTLDLSYNNFPIIPADAFEPYKNLKKLYLSSLFVVCNCLMEPFLQWVKQNSLRLKVKGSCHLPVPIRGRPLKNLKTKEICNSEKLTELPYFELSPEFNQLGFVGDIFVMRCEGTDLEASEVIWELNGEQVSLGTTTLINATTNLQQHRTVITGKLSIHNLQYSHSGTWKCTVKSEHGFQSKSINLLVASPEPTYCTNQNVTNDKGFFQWKETISGGTSSLSCPEKPTINSNALREAKRRCMANGTWESGIYNDCPYKDRMTSLVHEYLVVLQQGVSVDMLHKKSTDFKSNLVRETFMNSYSLHLLNMVIGNLTMSALNENANKGFYGELAIDLVSSAMSSDDEYLKEAEIKYKSCSSMLSWLRKYTTSITQTWTHHSSSIYIYVKKMELSGKPLSHLCIADTDDIDSFSAKCDYVENIRELSPEKQSMFIPRELIKKVVAKYKMDDLFYIIVYRNAALFQNSEDPTGKATLDRSAVFFESSLPGNAVEDLVYPVHYTIQSSNPMSMVARQWSGTNWLDLDSHCSVVPGIMAEKLKQLNLTRIICNNLRNLTLLKQPQIYSSLYLNLLFIHPVIFVGSTVLVLCMIAVIMSYIVLPSITISSEATHMLLNQCFHLILVTCAFAFGIRRVDFRELCTGSGIILHYASLAIVLWSAISSRNIYKEMVRAALPPMMDVKPPRPMLRFYLVGCGIPIMICGITAAAKIRHYGEDGQYCWLSWETSLFSFYLPAALAALVCIGFQVRILLALNRYSNVGSPTSHQRHYHSNSSSNPERYNNVLSGPNVYENTLLQQPPQGGNHNHVNNDMFNNQERMSIVNPNEICNEHSFRTRLRSATLFLVLSILTWVAAAVSVAAPVMQKPPTLDLATEWRNVAEKTFAEFQHKTNENMSRVSRLENSCSYIFAVLASGMGIFVLVQHVVSRKDVRQSFRKNCVGRCQKKTSYSDIRPSTALTARDDDSHYHTHQSTQDGLLSRQGTVENNSPSSYADNGSPKKIQRPRENTFGTITTDPTTMETVLQSTAYEEESLLSIHNSKNKNIAQQSNNKHNTDNSRVPPTQLSVVNSSNASFIPQSNFSAQGFMNPAHSSHGVNSLNYNQQTHPGSSGKHLYIIQPPMSKDHNPQRRGEPHKFAHMASPPQFAGDGGYNAAPHYKYPNQEYPYYHPYMHHAPCAHQPSNERTRLKMNNLQMDSSMTEHSLEEVSNMHTVPVVMQHHKQPKIANNVALYRYQKVKKKLEQKRGKSRKLTVLREYAQDPLTSNDEENGAPANKNNAKHEDSEGTPLLQSSKINQLPNEINPQSPSSEQGSKYRTLLISSPTRHKPDERQQSHYDKRRRRRSSDLGRRGRRNVGKQARQAEDIERERCTTSSDNAQDEKKQSTEQSINTNIAADTGSATPSPTKSTHGYLTIQQLYQGGMHLPIKSPTLGNTQTSNITDHKAASPEVEIEVYELPQASVDDPLSLSFSDTAEESELEFTKNIETESTTSPSVSTWRNETTV